MANNKNLWGLLTPTALVMGFALISAGCLTKGGKNEGEYVPAHWVMEEAAQIVYMGPKKFIPLPTTEEKQQASRLSKNDREDGLTLREYAENSSAQEGVWYVLTAPERPEKMFYAYHKRGTWTIIKIDISRHSGEYIPAYWVMEEVPEPNQRSLENIFGIKNDDIKVILYNAEIFRVERDKWYIFTSPERPGEIFYYRLHSINQDKMDAAQTEEHQVYRQK